MVVRNFARKTTRFYVMIIIIIIIYVASTRAKAVARALSLCVYAPARRTLVKFPPTVSYYNIVGTDEITIII